MVSHPGRTPDPRRIRRLKPPHAIEVEADGDGTPLRLQLTIGWQDVELVRRPWRIDQHWWRSDPIGRVYYRLTPPDGPVMTIYHDLTGDAWFRQEY